MHFESYVGALRRGWSFYPKSELEEIAPGGADEQHFDSYECVEQAPPESTSPSRCFAARHRSDATAEQQEGGYKSLRVRFGALALC